MAMLLDYLPLLDGPDEYESGNLTILGTATFTIIAHDEVYGEATIIGRAYLTFDPTLIHPVVTVVSPKHADIKSYIIRRQHEVEVSSASAHIEIAQRQADIKVIDID